MAAILDSIKLQIAPLDPLTLKTPLVPNTKLIIRLVPEILSLEISQMAMVVMLDLVQPAIDPINPPS